MGRALSHASISGSTLGRSRRGSTPRPSSGRSGPISYGATTSTLPRARRGSRRGRNAGSRWCGQPSRRRRSPTTNCCCGPAAPPVRLDINRVDPGERRPGMGRQDERRGPSASRIRKCVVVLKMLMDAAAAGRECPGAGSCCWRGNPGSSVARPCNFAPEVVDQIAAAMPLNTSFWCGCSGSEDCASEAAALDRESVDLLRAASSSGPRCRRLVAGWCALPPRPTRFARCRYPQASPRSSGTTSRRLTPERPSSGDPTSASSGTEPSTEGSEFRR